MSLPTLYVQQLYLTCIIDYILSTFVQVPAVAIGIHNRIKHNYSTDNKIQVY